MRVARLLEIAVGLVFVVGAAMKADNIPGFAAGIRSYRVFYDPNLLYSLAILTVAVETMLGASLVAGVRLRGFVHGLGVALLVFFSAMIAYAWAAYGLEDCGCFGDYVKMGPGFSIVKNIVMMAMLIVPWVAWSRDSRHTQRPLARPIPGIAISVLAIALVASVAAFGGKGPTAPGNPNGADAPASDPQSTPTGEYSGIRVTDNVDTYDLGAGTYLVAVMSATCDHCKASVEPLNNLLAIPTTPPIVGLMMGEPDELERFRFETAPMFPTQLVDTMLWLKLLGDAAEPPRFVLIRDGAPVKQWNGDVPNADAVAATGEPVGPAGEDVS